MIKSSNKEMNKTIKRFSSHNHHRILHHLFMFLNPLYKLIRFFFFFLRFTSPGTRISTIQVPAVTNSFYFSPPTITMTCVKYQQERGYCYFRLLSKESATIKGTSIWLHSKNTGNDYLCAGAPYLVTV